MARMSAAQPDNGAGAGCQASTQLDPVVLKARSAEEPPGEPGLIGCNRSLGRTGATIYAGCDLGS